MVLPLVLAYSDSAGKEAVKWVFGWPSIAVGCGGLVG